MNLPRGQPLVVGAWLTLIALATVRQALSPTGGLPSPAVYVGSSVLFTFFLAGAAVAPDLFGVLAVGVVVAALLKPYVNPDRTIIPDSGPVFQLSQLLDQISGSQKGGA